MEEAVRWAEEHSQAKGTALTLLWALARRAEGCVVQCTVEQATREGRLSRSEYYKAIRRLENQREIKRLLQSFDNARLRAFHLPWICESPTFRVFSPLCPRKQRRVSDLKDYGDRSDAEDCLLCRGTGWKMVPRPDASGYNWAVRCLAHVKQLALLSEPVKGWAPVITGMELEWRSEQLKKRPILYDRGMPLFRLLT